MTTPAPTPIEELLDVKDVMRLLKLKRTAVYEAVARGDFEHVRFGSRLRFEAAAVRRFVEKHRSSAPKATVLPIAGGRR